MSPLELMLGKGLIKERRDSHLNNGNISLHLVNPIGQICVGQLKVTKVSVDLPKSCIILTNLAASGSHSFLYHVHITQGVVEEKHIVVQSTHLVMWEEGGGEKW